MLCCTQKIVLTFTFLVLLVGEANLRAQSFHCDYPGQMSMIAIGNLEPRTLASADLDADGDVDAVATIWESQTAIVSLNDGTFENTNVGNSPSSIAIGDLDSDNDNDLVVANREDGTVTILIRLGNFYSPVVSYDVGDLPEAVIWGGELQAR